MPQVFGSDKLGLIAESSLWSEAGYVEDVEAHEGALHDAGFEEGNTPVNVDKTGFHPRGSFWGQHLRSDPGKDGNHTWAIARVANPTTDPNAKQFEIGGRPRYVVEIHTVPKNPQSTKARGSVTPIWEGNDIRHFLTGRGTGMGWPQVQKAMSTGPRRS